MRIRILCWKPNDTKEIEIIDKRTIEKKDDMASFKTVSSMMFFQLVTICLMSILTPVWSQQQEVIFQNKISLPICSSKTETLLQISKSFLGTPYVASTLEQAGKEQLVVNLNELDCWTFVEQTIALTLTKHGKTPNFQQFKKNLQAFRYRNGKVNGYGSRLHYFLEWLEQAKQNGIISLETEKIGGISVQKTIDFMSTHVQLYRALQDQEAYETVMAAEAKLSRLTWYYLPKNKVRAAESQIKEGDIITITAVKEGLDVVHEGFAIKKNGRIHLLHASLDLKEVVVSAEPLSNYLTQNKRQSGIIVARIVE